MKIGFYGHSTASWMNSPTGVSFIDRLAAKYSAEIVNIGVPQGSEERILFDLKKTKEIDIAVVFHSLPRYVFLPKCNRDVSINTVPSKKAEWFWAENGSAATRETFEKEFFGYSNIKDAFQTPEEFSDAMRTLKEYFYHPDLQINRFYANALMIDNYLFNRKIKSFQTMYRGLIQPWMNFLAGPIDTELTDLATTPVPNKYNNNLDLDGNNRVFEVLDQFIQNAW